MSTSTFSMAEAKQLLADYDELHRQLQQISEHVKSLKEELFQATSRVNSDPIVEKVVLSLLQGEDASLPYMDTAKRFAKAFVNYAQFEAAAADCFQLVNANAAREKTYISHLKKAASVLRAIFSGNAQKEMAQIAFANLAEWKSGVYGQKISAVYQSIGRQVQEDEAIQLLQIHPETYDVYLNTHEMTNQALRFAPVADITNTYTKLNAQVQQAEKGLCVKIAKLTVLIQENAHKVVAKEAVRQLNTLDVDLLGKLKNGTRVKALRDAGFQTIADIYTATASMLASINGISTDAAVSIKEAAVEIAKKSQESARIRLSQDSRTPESTILVNLIHQYIQAQEALNSIKAYNQTILGSVQQSLRELAPLTCCAVYIAESHKGRFQHAYQFLLSHQADVEWRVEQAQTVINDAVNNGWDFFNRDPVRYNTVLQEIVPELYGGMEGQYGLPEELARAVQEQEFFPKGLKVSLRRYQEWGVKYALHQGKIILGDEMGLGKTIQAIATMVSLKNTGANHFLVICPASVLPNWHKEVEKKSAFHATLIHGAGREAAYTEWLKTGGVAITTYETANHLKDHDDFQLDLLIVDEAHYIKNPQAQRSKAVKAISDKTDRIVFLTGTPLENQVDEMIHLVDILNHELAGELKNIAFLATAPLFRQRIAPIYYRRKREDVLQELPEKQEIDDYVDLLPEENDLYEKALLHRDRTAIRRVSWMIGDAEKSSKAIRFMQIVHEAEEDGRRVVAFTFYKETLRMLQRMLGSSCAGVIEGSVPVETRQALIDQFETMHGGSVLLAQINAGGTGLNIQTASVVIICEPQLKPSIEDQAISRAYRMGQARKVLVYRLLAADTIDERICELLDEKRQAFLAFADKSVAATATIDDIALEEKTFGKLIQEEIDRINQEKGNTPAADSLSFVPEEQTESEVSVEMVAEQTKEPDNPKPISPRPIKKTSAEDRMASDIRTDKTDPAKAKAILENFSSIDSFVRYLNDEEILYIDNRAKNGCLWVQSSAETDNLIRSITINGSSFKYSPSAKALGKKPGWYMS